MAVSMYPACATFKPRVLAGAQAKGLFVQLGSAATAELAARAGFDFVVLDQEHGLGGEDVLLAQLTALAGTACFPVVRLAWHEAARFKRALDLGACGVMIPLVDSAEQAAAAAAAMRYPPHGGVRGVAKTTRATNFGAAFDEYWEHAVERLLLVCQIETAAGVEAAGAIAAVDGVDVLFVGPTDLSVSLGGGKPLAFDDARLVAARRRVAAACKAAGKAAGILCALAEQVATVRAEGYSFVALGSDMGAAAAGIRAFAAGLAEPKAE